MKLYYEAIGGPPLGLKLFPVPGRELAWFRTRGMEGYRKYVSPESQLSLITTRDAGKLHLSIAHPSRYPTWDEILEVRNWFFPDEVEGKVIHVELAEDAGAKVTIFGAQPHVVVVQVAEELRHDVEQFVVARIGVDLRAVERVQGVPIDLLRPEDAVVSVERLPQVLEVRLRVAELTGRGAKGC